MSDVVECQVQDGVALVTLNRPDRLNAWTTELEFAYFATLEQCAESEDVRAIVVTGAGRGFCAGADMDDLQALGEDGVSAGERARERRPQSFPLSIPKPIVAAINGPCAGIGLVQALMCDIRFAAEGAKLTTAFARRGLVAEHGISWFLPRLVGPMNALDLLYSARLVPAAEAAQMGLVKLLPQEGFAEAAHAQAMELAQLSSPRSMAVIKRQIYDALTQPLAEAAQIADEEMHKSFSSEDFREGVAHFIEKRAPAFTGR
jgi:enoyl-CoA hydratase/carnithine racemase